MLYDCFTFSDELELLEVRLHELAHVVDRFVLVEATATFSGLPKRLLFDEARPRFEAFAGRIIHIVVDDLPDVADAWARERHQRDAVLRGLAGCRPDDLVLLSDVDEIPRASAVLEAARTPTLKRFQQRFYYYWLNCQCGEGCFSRLATYADLQRLSPGRLRTAEGEVLRDAGWHFSYMGGVERIQTKLQWFSHQEFNCRPYTEAAHIASAMDSGADLFGRAEMAFELVPVDKSYPAFIREHPERFAAWIRPMP